jgi:hypothetical protein
MVSSRIYPATLVFIMPDFWSSGTEPKDEFLINSRLDDALESHLITQANHATKDYQSS